MLASWDGVRSRNNGDIFTFVAGPKPAVPFSFTARSSQVADTHSHVPRRAFKRTRPLSDVDDEVSTTRKKKRRLRLLLITSRLSRPFSSPPTHIVDRGTSKIAVWAKQKALGRNLLRKQAILNRIRHITAATRETERRRMERARQAFTKHQVSHVHMPRRQYIPLPPSPLGLSKSNYDALDLEDDWPEAELDDEDVPAVNSDFNILEPSELVLDDYDSLDVGEDLSANPVAVKQPDGKVSEIFEERERQKEVSFVDFGSDWRVPGV